MTRWPRWYRYVGRGRLQDQLVLCVGWAHRAEGPRNGLFRSEEGDLVVAPFLRCVRKIAGEA